ncbi:MAG TPA: hypothetical protein PK836_03045 [Syntrophales bacterium]|nr:hypothetical protein [Syntrophales bacterium]HOM06528.1 hypothetical protein [Syntrophales bacterium]HON99913.1 hypothetical protein [Syntrophales bacterium]HPC00640.1 hypothetical protein [Syntrophales bacterium]HPQ06210.1 hypothetical protein [Syntrophales bacterium]
MSFNLFEHEYIARQPLFYLFIAFSALLGYGFFRGRRVNEGIFRSAFQDLLDIVRPVDQTFVNIGGTIGYHATLTPPKGGPVTKVEATITFLPRQALLWMPISLIIRRWDRLFVTLHLSRPPVAEGHLIEKGYARFRGPKIANAHLLKREDLAWGGREFFLYWGSEAIRGHLRRFTQERPDPGRLRHLALVPSQRRAFVFMIPKAGQVARDLGPVYRWLPTVLKGGS